MHFTTRTLPPLSTASVTLIEHQDIPDDLESSRKSKELLYKDIDFYSLAVILPVGMVCNILSVCVFLSSKMRNTTTGHLLIMLACSDFLVLLSEGFEWINAESPEGYRFGNVSCV